MIVVASAEQAGELAAARIGALLARGGPTLIGLPAGRTPRTTIAALARLAEARGLDLSRLEILMMDEYLDGGPGTLRYCPEGAAHSCRGFAARELRALVNRALPAGRQLPAAGIHCPDPGDPERTERELEARGGVDLFVLAAGAGDGHVAFNPPGTPLASRTRVIALSEQTRRDNLATFPSFRGLEDVPRFGVSVGLGTIVRHSRATLLLLLGADKRAALARTLALAGFDAAWPASVVHACAGAEIVADAEATGGSGAYAARVG